MNRLASHRLFCRTWNDTHSYFHLQPNLFPEICTRNQERNVILWLVTLRYHKLPSFYFLIFFYILNYHNFLEISSLAHISWFGRMEKRTSSQANTKVHPGDGISFLIKPNLTGTFAAPLLCKFHGGISLDIDGNLPTPKINVYSVAITLLIFGSSEIEVLWPLSLRISNLMGETESWIVNAIMVLDCLVTLASLTLTRGQRVALVANY